VVIGRGETAAAKGGWGEALPKGRGRGIAANVYDGDTHVAMVAEVTVGGVAGDAQREREFHGGPDRALCLFSMELIRTLQAEGHPIAPGQIGENLTVEGLEKLHAEVQTAIRAASDEAVLSPQPPVHTAQAYVFSPDVDPASAAFDTPAQSWATVVLRLVSPWLWP